MSANPYGNVDSIIIRCNQRGKPVMYYTLKGRELSNGYKPKFEIPIKGLLDTFQSNWDRGHRPSLITDQVGYIIALNGQGVSLKIGNDVPKRVRVKAKLAYRQGLRGERHWKSNEENAKYAHRAIFCEMMENPLSWVGHMFDI